MIGFSERLLPEVTNRIWALRKQGRSAKEIGQVVGWSERAVRGFISDHGGIDPRKKTRARSLSFDLTCTSGRCFGFFELCSRWWGGV